MPRAYGHDYRCRCIYHITMNKTAGWPPFGYLTGTLPEVSIERSSLGRIVEQNIRSIQQLNSHIRLLQYAIMPDHIHLLIFVTNTLERAIGSYIGMFKVKTGQDARRLLQNQGPLFADDFYDRILFPNRPLDTIFKYIRDNPRRLAVRRKYPDFFRRINQLSIFGNKWQAYGNIQLLDNPFKEQVVIHRSDSEDTRVQNRNRWLHAAANGGILVSPFISPDEKTIRMEAEDLGCRQILVTNKAFCEKFKPSAHDFGLCEKGQLLIIAPMETLPSCRSVFLELNRVSAYIANNTDF